MLHRHVDKIRIAVPGLAVGEGELGAFDDEMDKIRPERVEAVEIETLQQRQLLQQHRPLAPRAALGDRVAAIVEGDRRLDRRLPARHVVAGQQPAMAAAGDVEHFFAPAETVDRLGDKAAVPRVAGALDLAVAPAVAGLGEDAPVGRGERRVAEQPARLRRHAVRQIDRRRARPFAAEQLGDGRDRHADLADRRIAVLGIADRRAEDFGERHRPVIAQQPHPGAERRGNRGGEQPGAGDQVEPELAETRRSSPPPAPRPGRRSSRSAGSPRSNQHRRLAERAVQMRLDHLQGEAGRGRGIEGIAALFEDAHADRRGDPMGRATTPKVPRISGRVVKASIASLQSGRPCSCKGRRGSSEALAIAIPAGTPMYSRSGRLSACRSHTLREMDVSMPLDVPADTTLSGEEFFRTEGAYTSLGAPIPGGRVANWLLREGPKIESDVELFDELCWRLVGDGLPLFRATLHMGTLHPQIRGLGVRWLRTFNVVEEYRILQGNEATGEYLRSPIRATIERGTASFRQRLTRHPRVPVTLQAQGFRHHRLFRPGAQPHLPPLSGGDLGHGPPERVQRL